MILRLFIRQFFQEPDWEELTSVAINAPPEGFASWRAWTSSRWPTSLDD
jgi:hypothetical protein